MLALRPQNTGDDSSGWHVNSVHMEPYVAHPTTLVRVCILMSLALYAQHTSSAALLHVFTCTCTTGGAVSMVSPALQQGHIVPPAEGDPVRAIARDESLRICCGVLPLPFHPQDSSCGNLLVAESAGAAAQVPLFKTAVVDGQRVVTDIEPVFSSRLNPGNTFLVIIEVPGHAHVEMSAGHRLQPKLRIHAASRRNRMAPFS